MEEFGFNPYIIVDGSWLRCDPTVDNPAVIDGVHNWFTVGPGWSMTNFNNNSYGVCVPGFRVINGDAYMNLDAAHGATFTNNLMRTANKKPLITLVEGFTDWEENCSVWRSTDTRYYDYPNQRINIMRKFSNNPFPADLKMEAEACDFYNDITTGNTFNQYRDGNLDVNQCNDAGGGWNVCAVDAGEWLEWKEVPLQGTVTLKLRYATPNADRKVRFVIDGVASETVTLPSTGGWDVWQTADVQTVTLPAGSYHTIRLEFIDDGINVNYWTN
jgi:hypothetical protein